MTVHEPLRSVPDTAAASLTGVGKRYGEGEAAVAALSEIDCEFAPGTFTAIMGPSGSGKSTLLQVMAGLIAPTDGVVTLGGQRIDNLPEQRLALVRREHVGFVFQEFNLIDALTARENIAFPVRLARRRLDERWLAQLTERAGIVDRLNHLPDQLSGGQQQRVALCRALLTRPALVCADEPTGALDSVSSQQVMGLMREMVDEYGQAIVLVTHDATAASYADRVVVLVDGRITTVLESPTRQVIADALVPAGDV